MVKVWTKTWVIVTIVKENDPDKHTNTQTNSYFINIDLISFNRFLRPDEVENWSWSLLLDRADGGSVRYPAVSSGLRGLLWRYCQGHGKGCWLRWPTDFWCASSDATQTRIELRQWDNNNQQMGDCWDFYSHQWSWNSRKLAQFYGAEYRAIWFVLDLISIYLSIIGISTIFDKIDIHFA